MAAQDHQHILTDAAMSTTTVASVRVFAIPELVEKILEHAPPASLYGLRRVSTTFNGSIDLKKFQQPMLLEPLGRLSLMRLYRVLQSSQVQHAIRPFTISMIHARDGGRKVHIQVDVPHSYNPLAVQWPGMAIAGGSPCQQPGSWRDIQIDCGGKELEVFLQITSCAEGCSFDGRNKKLLVKEWMFTEDVTLGEVVDACVRRRDNYKQGLKKC